MGKTLIYASAMSGQLVDGSGRPAAGVTITRTWQTSSKTGSDSTTTDDDGRFAFGSVEQRSLFGGLNPGTPLIDQQFTHDMTGTPKMFLRMSKRSFGPNSELDGRPINLVCRADTDPEPGPGPILSSTCRILD
ncbi:hypothetical protein RGUI_4248 (plasmid) [Rhodovulum sp. P5]|nr:hypothetical protein RGUI_4248 [Rhodovulum sp. P5]